jgi:branched-chain amino acid transport system ATP-binding protein
MRFGGVQALADVTLSFVAGETCGLIGPNGAGKTTLLDCLSGLRPPSSGSVSLSGTDVSRMSLARRARLGLRRTFQRPQTFGWLTVEDNVLVALESHTSVTGFLADLVRSGRRLRRERDRRQQVLEILDRCGLSNDRSALAGTLPIGRTRLLELARAIVVPPRVLLLDEPASGLDAQGADRLGHVVRQVSADSSCAVIIVEHDMRFVMEMCERLIVLNLGEVLADGPLDDVRARADVTKAYLG